MGRQQTRAIGLATTASETIAQFSKDNQHVKTNPTRLQACQRPVYNWEHNQICMTSRAGVYAIGNLVLPIKPADQCALEGRALARVIRMQI